MFEPTLLIEGVKAPRLVYGTAWKEDATQRLTQLAIGQGFRGIDTANQRRHYDEAAVGRGVSAMIEGGVVTREELFLQTKFTFMASQDHRLPYDPLAPIAQQVEQSFASSLVHLGVEMIDSYLLHGPNSRDDLGKADWDAWRAMENLHDSGRVRILGASNMTLKQLQSLVKGARIRPRILQNRCYASRGWDRHIRGCCKGEGVIYQGFSLLTANREALAHPGLIEIARRHARSVSEIVFRFATQVGMIALTGTSSADHMRADLRIEDFHLHQEEITRIERLLAS